MRPQLFPNKWILHQDNAPSHTVVCVNEVLLKESIMTLEPFAHLPDLAPCDFFLFHIMKNHLKGSHLETVEEIHKVTMVILSRKIASESAATAGNNTGVHVSNCRRELQFRINFNIEFLVNTASLFVRLYASSSWF
jgi:hypothetical protein